MATIPVMGDVVSQPDGKIAEDQDRTFLPICPICGGATSPAHEVRPSAMFACAECETTIFVPPGAWATARTKRLLKWQKKP